MAGKNSIYRSIHFCLPWSSWQASEIWSQIWECSSGPPIKPMGILITSIMPFQLKHFIFGISQMLILLFSCSCFRILSFEEDLQSWFYIEFFSELYWISVTKLTFWNILASIHFYFRHYFSQCAEFLLRIYSMMAKLRL